MVLGGRRAIGPSRCVANPTKPERFPGPLRKFLSEISDIREADWGRQRCSAGASAKRSMGKRYPALTNRPFGRCSATDENDTEPPRARARKRQTHNSVALATYSITSSARVSSVSRDATRSR